MNFFSDNLQIPILFPLWIFLLIVVGRFLNIKMPKLITSIMSLISVIIGFVFFTLSFKYLSTIPQFADDNTFKFLNIGHLYFELGYFIDRLALFWAMCISLVCFFTQVYTIFSLDESKSYSRIFAYLNLFYFSLLGFALSPNLFQTSIFSFLITICMYLINGFWYKKENSSQIAQKTLFISIVSDIILLAVYIVFSGILYSNVSQSDFISLPLLNLEDAGNYLYSYTNEITFVIISMLLFISFAFKMFLLPVSAWISEDNDAPVPVLSLVYVSLVCINSLYMIRRYFDLYTQSHFVINSVLILSAFISFICLYYSFVKSDDFSDLIYYFFKNKIFKNLCNFASFIDKYIVDGLYSIISYITRSFSWLFMRMQSGNIQSYITYGIFIITFMFVSLIIAYFLILQYGLIGG